MDMNGFMLGIVGLGFDEGLFVVPIGVELVDDVAFGEGVDAGAGALPLTK